MSGSRAGLVGSAPDTPHRVVVVGASLAGLRAAEGLRAEGFDGELVVVGDEERLPYDRPPLSKELLQGRMETEETELRPPIDGLGAELRLGCRAERLDLDRREVVLRGGERVAFDGLVIATGAAPRTLPGTHEMPGVFVLRTLDDALELRAELDEEPRVVVVGAGFIGSEVAASCRARGLDVTVLEALAVPLVNALGAEMGAAVSAVHLDHDVDLRCGVGVVGFEGTARVEGVGLSDGTVVPADVVVVGIGVAPVTGWLEGSGLELANGVVCDSTCATAAPGVVAAGDVARWHNPLFDEHMRVEHWDNANQQGRAAARTLLGSTEAFAPVPYFWSDQYDRKIQFVGRAAPYDEVAVVNGTVEERAFVAIYRRDDRIVGALSMNRPRLLMGYRSLIAERATWARAVEKAAE